MRIFSHSRPQAGPPKWRRPKSTPSSIIIMFLSLMCVCLPRTVRGLALFSDTQCQYMSSCDITETVAPVITNLDHKIARLAAFESESTFKYYELRERLDVIEEEIGLPHHRKKPLKTENPSSPEALWFNPHVFDVLGRTNHKRVRSLLERMLDIEMWQERMESSVLPTMGSRLEEMLLRHAGNIPKEEQVSLDEKIAEMQQEMKDLRLNYQERIGQLERELTEEQEKSSKFEAMFKTQEQSSIGSVVMLMESFNDSFSSQVEDFRHKTDVNLEKQKKKIEDVDDSLDRMSEDVDRRLNGFFDDLHVLMDDIDRVEEEQAMLRDETELKLTTMENKVGSSMTKQSLDNTEIRDDIDLIKNQLRDLSENSSVSEMRIKILTGLIHETTSKNEIFQNITEELSSIQTQTEERANETYRSVVKVVRENLIPNVTSHLDDRLTHLEKLFSKKEQQIHANSVQTRHLTNEVGQLQKYLQGNASHIQEIQNGLNEISIRLGMLNKSEKLHRELGHDVIKSLDDIQHRLNHLKLLLDDSLHDEPNEPNENKGQQQIPEPEFLKMTRDYYDGSKCTIHTDPSSHLVVSVDGRPLTEPFAFVDTGQTVHYRCDKIGAFKFIGNRSRTCRDGEWDPSDEPICQPLLTLNDFASGSRVDKNSAPSIVISPISGTIGVNPSGDLIVLPNSDLRLICIFPLTSGRVQWYLQRSRNRLYRTGEWLNDNRFDPNRHFMDSYRYQTRLSHMRENNSGLYTCETSFGTKHSINVIVQELNCPFPVMDVNAIEIVGDSNNRMNSVLQFQCKNNQFRLVWPEKIPRDDSKAEVQCLPSGKWSSDFPKCVGT